MTWIILDSRKNNYGELIVTYLNIKTKKEIESIFSEGEHSQADYFLSSLNEGESREKT